MQEWLIEDKNRDPFDLAAPMDHEDIARHMQHYWVLHYKRSKKQEDKSGKGKRKDREDGKGGKSGRSNKCP